MKSAMEKSVTAKVIKEKPIIGQECICPDGLGRVMDYYKSDPPHCVQWIKVTTYINDRQRQWEAKDVELINPRGLS